MQELQNSTLHGPQTNLAYTSQAQWSSTITQLRLLNEPSLPISHSVLKMLCFNALCMSLYHHLLYVSKFKCYRRGHHCQTTTKGNSWKPWNMQELEYSTLHGP